jgi:hypothetical protein
MSIIIDEKYLPILAKNQDSLIKLLNSNKSNVLDYLINTTLVADRINDIPVWKIFKNDKPHHYCYIPAWNYQRVLEYSEIVHYTSGVFEIFLNDEQISKQLQDIQQKLKPYSELEYELYNNKTRYNENFCEVNIILKCARHIKIKVDLFALKEENYINSVKEFVKFNQTMPGFPTLLNHIETIESILKEKSSLENNISNIEKLTQKVKL